MSPVFGGSISQQLMPLISFCKAVGHQCLHDDKYHSTVLAWQIVHMMGMFLISVEGENFLTCIIMLSLMEEGGMTFTIPSRISSEIYEDQEDSPLPPRLSLLITLIGTASVIA